ncbi:iron-containing redox enzyme family protein [Acinetobacter indicus]
MQNCERYQQYLSRRQAGGQREYFQHVAAAYDFLVKVAPVKYVDGSWLYSTLKHWSDPNFQHLIMIYLEELGLGSAKANHVSMYQQLLSSLNLQDLVEGLEDEYYYQPVVQLALAYAPQQYLPEVIGFNLGYEQLPLHLLISNYELAELGLDHQYFNVHITIDNLDNGHAHRSVAALEYAYSQAANKTEFIEKLKRGYALNDVGLGSTEIIKNSDLTPLIEKIFKKKLWSAS